jgi:hypothetical protein
MRLLPVLGLAVAVSIGGLPAAAAGPAAGSPPAWADVLAVRAGGPAGAYAFAVTVRRPDTGCGRYADWWEVLRPDGTLVCRRILLHSHGSEQPFTRSGGPVDAGPDETLVVRAHLPPDGYGGALLRGTVRGGFERWTDPPAGFAAALATAPPQPGRGWF